MCIYAKCAECWFLWSIWQLIKITENINNLIGQVGKYQVGGFPFNRTFLNLRTTFQFSSLVKHQLDWYKYVSIYWILVIPCIKKLINLYSTWNEVRLERISLRQLRPRTGANGIIDAGLPRYNTPSRYLDSTTKSPYGRTVVNQYLHRIVEAADKDKFRENICLYFGGAPTEEEKGRLKNILLQKSQIQTTILLKNLLNFLSPLLERFMQNLFWKSLQKLTFPLLAGSCFRTPLPVKNAVTHFAVQNV